MHFISSTNIFSFLASDKSDSLVSVAAFLVIHFPPEQLYNYLVVLLHKSLSSQCNHIIVFVLSVNPL